MITLDIEDTINGKRLRALRAKELCLTLKNLGREGTDIIVKDGDKEVAGYDSESGMAYIHMTVKEAFLTAMGLIN